MEKKILSFMSFIMSVSIFSSVIVPSSSTINASAFSEPPSEIMEMRSQYEKHFDNHDGTKTAYVYTSPIHYLENGEWVDIDNTLVKSEKGTYTNAHNSMNVTLASQTAAKMTPQNSIEHLMSLSYGRYGLSMDLMTGQIDKDRSVSTFPSCIEVCSNDNQLNGKNAFEDTDLNSDMKSVMESKISTARYKSIFNGIDMYYNIKPASVQEDIVIFDKTALQNPLTYYVDLKNLEFNLCEDSSIECLDEAGNIIFYIPAPLVYELDSDKVYSGMVDVSIEDYGEGYIMSFIPNNNFSSYGEMNYPLSIRQTAYVYNSIYTETLSEGLPNSHVYFNGTVKVGGNYGNRYAALVTIPTSTIFSNDHITITDAKLHLYFRSCDSTDQKQLRISALTSEYMPWWSSITFNNLSEMERFDVSLLSYNSLDVTKIISAWQNYYRSNGHVGKYPYGVILHTLGFYCTVYQADSDSGIYPPYYTVSYNTDSDYTFTYSSAKYDDMAYSDSNSSNEIYNFTQMMNCYAYALQLYDSNHNPTSTFHRLTPGEMSLSINPAFNTRSDLIYHYSNVISSSSQLMDFTEQQMMYDSTVMGTNLQKITLSNENQFVLPTGYNESTQRIIAMNAGRDNGSSSKDFHFYVRHGNGSCTLHGGNCSIWSHKRGYNRISNTLHNSQNQNVPICDNNIAQLAYKASFSSITGTTMVYDTRLRFYTIQLDANVYNDGYYYNSSSDKTMYVY